MVGAMCFGMMFGAFGGFISVRISMGMLPPEQFLRSLVTVWLVLGMLAGLTALGGDIERGGRIAAHAAGYVIGNAIVFYLQILDSDS